MKHKQSQKVFRLSDEQRKEQQAEFEKTKCADTFAILCKTSLVFDLDINDRWSNQINVAISTSASFKIFYGRSARVRNHE